MSDKARAMALCIAGQGQTDMGLNQRTGIGQVELGGLSCDKADATPSFSSNTPQPSTPQKISR